MILAAVREAWSSGHVLLKWGVNPVSCDPIFQRTTMHYAGMVGANPTDCQLLVEKMDEVARLHKVSRLSALSDTC